MMPAITPLEFKQISKLLHDQCGINLQNDQDYLIETRLSDFASSLGLTTFRGVTVGLRCFCLRKNQLTQLTDLEIAQGMVAKGFDMQTIIEITGLTEELIFSVN